MMLACPTTFLYVPLPPTTASRKASSVSLNGNRPDSSTLPFESDTVAVQWFSLVSTFSRTQAEA